MTATRMLTCLAMAGCLACMGGRAAAAPAAAPVTLETQDVRWVVGPDGYGAAFVDKHTGRDYLAKEPRHAFAYVKKDGRVSGPASCAMAGDLITVTFADPEVRLDVRVTAKPRWLVLEVASVSDAGVEEVGFGGVRVAVAKDVSHISYAAIGDEFAVAARPLNLRTPVHLDAGASTAVTPYGTQARGIVGAKVALVACPSSALRPVLQDLVRQEGLPWSPLGGPFALDAEENRGSYVFATVSEQNAQEWIALARKAGLAQIHLIGWERTLGHYEPRPDLFPNGLEGLKAVVAKMHAAGLKVGMHTLTGGIARDDPFVTPVPDRRLAKDGRFALAADIDENAPVVPTAERPGDLETSWQYSGRCNVVQVGDELIQYTGLAQEPPFGLTGCTRGAMGTRRAAHAKGETVHHLFAIYGLFQPDEESALVDAVADRIAGVFNACGFDMIYQDGAEGMPGGPYGWAKMREAIFRRLKGRVLVEASEWNAFSWPYHSRLGAYDYPHWGLKRFTDVHCRDSQRYQGVSLLAAQLGWWAILGPGADHPAEFPDEIEYLCAKSLATDLPMSFQGIDVGRQPPNARQDEYLEMIGRYERLRLARAVPEGVRAQVGVPGAEFRLAQAADGSWQFDPTDYATHKVTGTDDGSREWTVRNRFGSQPLRLRVEALYSAAPYDAPEAVVLARFDRADELAVTGTAEGVTASWAPSTDVVQQAAASARYTAASTRADRSGAWARLGKAFAPPVDIGRCGAVGLWIHGDGKGELLNVQLTNPLQFWPAWAEHYVDVDFTGWRYVELHLRERDAERFGDYAWPYGGTSAVFRSPLIRSHTSALAIYYNHLPPGQTATCHLGPVKALPTVKVLLKNPSVRVGGETVTFPVSIESGQYLEMESPTECVLRDERGAVLQRIAPGGQVPTLTGGENRVVLACEGPDGHRARLRVTIITQGPPLAWPQKP